MGRLIVDKPASGVWNMSVDQALLDSVQAVDDWTLRFYSWSEPTLSLGYFQKYADRGQHQESSAVTCVRRSTGGGAILHDDDITYSLICPAKDRLSSENQQLYLAVHRALQAALGRQGVSVAIQPETVETNSNVREAEEFLCFLRRGYGDVILGGHKVCGSAQRRAKRAIKQHGSLNFSTSRFAPQINGLDDLAPVVERGQFLMDWIDEISIALNRKFERGEMTGAELTSAEMIAKDKYGDSAWNEKR